MDGSHVDEDDDRDVDEAEENRDDALDDDEAEEDVADDNFNRHDEREVDMMSKDRRRGLFILMNSQKEKVYREV